MLDNFPKRPMDFFIDVQRGKVPGHSMVHKFGRNDAVANAVWEGVLQVGAQFPWSQAATPMRIKIGGAVTDTAAGTGAREVTLQGLNAAGIEITEALASTGTSVSLSSSNSFIRLYRAWVSAVGAYGSTNSDAIIIENSTSGTDYITIAAGEGQTQFAGYSIPAGKTGYLLSLHLTVDAGKAADFRVFTRENLTDITAPMSAKRLKLYFDGILQPVIHKPYGAEFMLDELTDIWVEARGGGATSQVSADFELLLVDN